MEEETKMRGNTVSHMPCKLKCLLAFNIWVSCEDNTDTKIQTYRNVIFLFFIALLNVYSFKKKKKKKKEILVDLIDGVHGLGERVKGSPSKQKLFVFCHGGDIGKLGRAPAI